MSLPYSAIAWSVCPQNVFCMFSDRCVLCGAVRASGPLWFYFVSRWLSQCYPLSGILWWVPNCSARRWHPESSGIGGFWFQRIGKGDAGASEVKLKILLQRELGCKLEKSPYCIYKNNYYEGKYKFKYFKAL